MEVVYSWSINQMNEVPQEGSLYDVVVSVFWTRQGTTIVNDITYSATMWGAYDCPSPSPTDFTAYPDLTQEQVISWLDAGVDIVPIDQSINEKLDYLINPPIINLPFPWDIPAPVTEEISSSTSGTSTPNV